MKSITKLSCLSLFAVSVAVGASGCSSCGEAEKKVEKAEIKGPPAVKAKAETIEKVQESQASVNAPNSPASKLAAIPMDILTAEEPARTVDPAVQAAKDLILKNDAASSEEARKQLTAFIQANPDNADAHYWLGRSYPQDGAKADTIAAFQAAVAKDAEFIHAQRWLNWALFSEKRCAEASSSLDFVVQKSPSDAGGFIDRAVCGVQTDNWERAIADFSAACDLGRTEICTPVNQYKNLEELQAKVRDRSKSKGEPRERKANSGGLIQGMRKDKKDGE